MKKQTALAIACAGLTSITVSGLFIGSSIASSSPSVKQVSQPDAPVVEPSLPVDQQIPQEVPEALPEPEIFRSPVATIETQNGEVDIRLVNETNVPVRYSVLGDTDDRMLAARSEVYLSGLGVPVEMTFYREDNGFVSANPQAISTGVLELRLDETSSFSGSESGLIIQETGEIVID